MRPFAPPIRAARPIASAALLSLDQLKLYTLIWKRMLACQMAHALFDQVAADIAVRGVDATFRATGSTIAFDGFIKVYTESLDDKDDEGDQALPP